MSVVNISDVTVLSNPAKFTDPYVFRITFECLVPLEGDLEWKLIYVGSAENESYDQELDTCMVGPVPVGVNSFEFEAAAPNPNQIPVQELIGVTVILLTCSYEDQEFVRIGYYVNTEYASENLKTLYEQSKEEGAAERGVKPPDPLANVHDIARQVYSRKRSAHRLLKQDGVATFLLMETIFPFKPPLPRASPKRELLDQRC